MIEKQAKLYSNGIVKKSLQLKLQYMKPFLKTFANMLKNHESLRYEVVNATGGDDIHMNSSCQHGIKTTPLEGSVRSLSQYRASKSLVLVYMRARGQTPDCAVRSISIR